MWRATGGTAYQLDDVPENNVTFLTLPVAITCPPPPAPTNLQAGDGASSDYVSVTWEVTPGPAGIASVNILRRPKNGAIFAPIYLGWGGTTFNDTSAAPGQEYEYQIRVTNLCGTTSAFSDSDYGFRRLARPTGVSATDGEHRDRVRIVWESVSGAGSYAL